MTRHSSKSNKLRNVTKFGCTERRYSVQNVAVGKLLALLTCENEKDFLSSLVSNASIVHCKNIRRFYGKIAGNQLPVHFPLFFTGVRKHFQESGTER